jgi:hypothetical protein
MPENFRVFIYIIYMALEHVNSDATYFHIT